MISSVTNKPKELKNC